MRFLPGQDWGVVMFGNSDDAFYVLQILFHQLMDDVLKVPQEERIDWPAYWRKCHTDEEEEEEGDPELLPPESPAPLPVPLHKLAGGYFNAGYRTLVLTHNDGRLEADCTDRCMPFTLRFNHLCENKFAAEYKDLLDRSRRKLKTEFEICEDGVVQGMGIALCDGMKDELIWFQKRR